MLYRNSFIKKSLIIIIIFSMMLGYVSPCIAYSNPGSFASSAAEIVYAPATVPVTTPGDAPHTDTPSGSTSTADVTEEWVYHEYVRWIEGHVYEDSGNTSELVSVDRKGVPGVLVGTTSSSGFNTATNNLGYYKMTLNGGDYKVNFKYGDLAALDFDSSLSVGDILKYNGYDYAVSDFSEATIYDYNIIKREIIDSGKGAAQVFLLIDVSYSMSNTYITADGTSITKLQHSINAAKTLVKDLLDEGDNIYIGVIAYAGNCFRAAGLSKDKDFLLGVLDKIPRYPYNTWAGGTDIKQALLKAEESFYIDEDDPDYLEHCNRNIVLVSDGVPTAVNGPDPAYGDFIYVGQNPEEAFNTLITRIGPQTRQEIVRLRTDEKINIMTLIGETNDSDEVEFLNSIYSGSVDLFKIAQDEEDLANIIKNDIKDWVRDQLEEVEFFNNNYQIISGAEDADRRTAVDKLFDYKFYYDADLNLREERLSPQTVLFKKALSATSKTAEAQKLSTKTDMTAHTTETIHIDSAPSLFARIFENRDEEITKTRADGTTYKCTVHHRIKEVGATLDMYLQRRQEFPLVTKITATGLRIILSDGQVLSVQTKDFGDATPIMEVIDDNIAHGATIEVEYTIQVKNDSSLQCNHLEVLTYIPNEFVFSPERELITEDSTNAKYGWQSSKIKDLNEDGYITETTYREFGKHQIQSALVVLDNEGKGQNGFFLAPGGEYRGKIVVTRVVSNAEDVPNTITSSAEVMGYRNNGNRRMSYTDTTSLTGSATSNALVGYYPGDSRDADFAMSTNPVFVLPPTGLK